MPCVTRDAEYRYIDTDQIGDDHVSVKISKKLRNWNEL